MQESLEDFRSRGMETGRPLLCRYRRSTEPTAWRRKGNTKRPSTSGRELSTSTKMIRGRTPRRAGAAETRGRTPRPTTSRSAQAAPQGLPMKEPLELKRYIRSIPDFPKPGIVFRDITPLLAAPPRFSTSLTRWPITTARHGSTQSWRPRRGASSSQRPWLLRFRRGSFRSANRASSPSIRTRSITSWNTAPIRWRCTRTPSRRRTASCWWMISSPRAAQRGRASAWWKRPGPSSSGRPFSSSWTI